MAKKLITDPYAAREAEKYTNPIPSREYILQYLQEHGSLLRRADLVQAFNLKDPEQQEALRRRLRAMERDGQLVFASKKGYGQPEKMITVIGRVIGHKDGFGFVVPDDGSNDLFLNAREMKGVFDGDRVIVRVTGIDKRGRREAIIAEVIQRNTQFIVGRYVKEEGRSFVIPDSKKIPQHILISSETEKRANPGQIVVVEILEQPTSRKQATGRIKEVLGNHMAPGMEIEIAVRSYGIPHIWPKNLLRQTANLHEEVLEADKVARVDLRKLPLVTIDGEDAKDFDDAVYCAPKKGKKGWNLYVAIADVSHYVEPGSALDQEAFKRGTSVYFPGSVIPMLPEILSNGLCSLKPKVDRLCMVCEMSIDNSGELMSYRFYPAVMHSHARLTYTEVAQLLASDSQKTKQEKLLPHLKNLLNLYEKLHERREARGAIDFETTETKVIFGKHRKIEQIVPTQRTIAHRIIEECMLMANVSAAQFIIKQKLPSLFRVHSGPTVEKLDDLRGFLGTLGLRLPGGKIPTPADYGKLLKSIHGRPDAHLIQTVLLRSLSQAVYSPDNEGHFGLAFEAYTHFTSPIRRYPDLLVHRAIRFALTKRKAKTFYYDHQAMVETGEHCSITERRADEATRDALDWLKCEFMQDRVGEVFSGIITSVTGFGLFVELSDIYVEGLVHVTALKSDYYHFDSAKRHMRGERTGTIYRLGDAVKVRVAKVNLDERKIDFELLEEKTQIANKKIIKQKRKRKK